jgi:hypothetical protein
MMRDVIDLHALEVERDPDPPRRGAAIVSVKLQ